MLSTEDDISVCNKRAWVNCTTMNTNNLPQLVCCLLLLNKFFDNEVPERDTNHKQDKHTCKLAYNELWSWIGKLPLKVYHFVGIRRICSWLSAIQLQQNCLCYYFQIRWWINPHQMTITNKTWMCSIYKSKKTSPARTLSHEARRKKYVPTNHTTK